MEARLTDPQSRESESSRAGGSWAALTAVEVCLAVLAVALDLLLPTLVLLVLMAASLAVRRVGPGSLGFRRPPSWSRVAASVALITVVWTGLQFAVIIPALEHATGSRQDLSTFAGLQGDPVSLAVLLLASWTLAALGEETAYRGYLQLRIAQLWGPGRPGAVIAVLVSSALFGLAHLEQGAVGVGATFADALLFSWLARRTSAGLWAAVLAHGFNNTLGLSAFFLTGPIHGPW